MILLGSGTTTKTHLPIFAKCPTNYFWKYCDMPTPAFFHFACTGANIYFNSRAPFSNAMNSGICPKCGLPKELCICEEVAKEQQRISVKVSKRRYGKEVTVVDGLDPYEIDLEDLSKYLKGRLACGGTVKENSIELQGNHRDRVKELLTTRGYSIDNIS